MAQGLTKSKSCAIIYFVIVINAMKGKNTAVIFSESRRSVRGGNVTRG